MLQRHREALSKGQSDREAGMAQVMMAPGRRKGFQMLLVLEWPVLETCKMPIKDTTINKRRVSDRRVLKMHVWARTSSAVVASGGSGEASSQAQAKSTGCPLR